MAIIRDPTLPRINRAATLALTRSGVHQWNKKDCMIYALGIGMSRDPTDEAELRFAYEEKLLAFPTFPAAIGFHGGPLEDIGIDYRYVLHGEHSVTLHRTIPVTGKASWHSRILGAWDKGPQTGAVFSQEKTLTLVGETEPLATIVTTSFGRAEGGFGGPSLGQPRPHMIPDREPDANMEIPTDSRQALFYRLSGDLNPLHADPETAKAAGFPRPILHGLCSFAICCRAVMQTYCNQDPTRISHHQLRFAAPVFPGETLNISMWRDENIISFEASVEERGVTVIRNGMTILADSSELKTAETCSQ
tara:strand:+ start:24035 stop:24949 length:915 start_codon:yes stop_codon:yes gene_type:complete